MGLTNLQLAFNGTVEATVAIVAAVLLSHLPEEITGVHRRMMHFNFVHAIVFSFSATAYVWTIQKRQVFYIATGGMVCFLGVIIDHTWDCRVYHQLVETCIIILCTILTTLMRKMISHLKNSAVVETVDVTQKCLLCASIAVLATEVFVSGVVVRIVKMVCWAGILAKLLYHFMRYNFDLRSIFSEFMVIPRAQHIDVPSVNSAPGGNDAEKMLRLKKKLKMNMQLNAVTVCLIVAMYAWWPEGTEGVGCTPRSFDGIFSVRITIATFGGLMANASFLHSIWMFKKKRAREEGAPNENKPLVVQAADALVSAVLVCCNPALLERKWRTTIRTRSTHFHRKMSAVFVGLVVIADICIPLFVTETGSFGEAEEVCYSRSFARLEIWRQQDYDDIASRHLFPAHWLNSLSLTAAYSGFLLWLFCSPHMSVAAAHLDRTCGSFFTLNLLANIFSTGANMNNCVGGKSISDILVFLALLSIFAMSIIGCNVLCHRYMIEKAKTMLELIDSEDDNSPSQILLKKVVGSLSWEIRVCFFLFVVAAPTWMLFEEAGLWIAGFGMVVVIVIDTYMSVIITKLFVRPISKVLAEGSGVANDSEGYKSMLQSKWLTLVGSTLIVASSTVLYVRMILQFTWGGHDGELWRNRWLNVFVFGVNVNSTLNTIGMIFVCGVLKKLSKANQPAEVRSGGILGRETEFQADSQASSNYAPEELQQSVMRAEEGGLQTALVPASTLAVVVPVVIPLSGDQETIANGGLLQSVACGS